MNNLLDQLKQVKALLDAGIQAEYDENENVEGYQIDSRLHEAIIQLEEIIDNMEQE